MDLHKILGELYAELQKVKRNIERLERLHRRKPGQAPKKRGRRHMDAEARKAVSERMQKYWAAKRAQPDADDPPVKEEPPLPPTGE